MPRKPKIEAEARPSTFWSRNRRTILSTTFMVFFLSLLITLFQAPIYQSTATIGGAPAPDPAAQARALQAPDVLRESLATLGPDAAKGAGMLSIRAVDFASLMPGRFALIVESDDPQYSADVANAWANTVVGESSGRAKVVLPAEAQSIPIRPKKAQSLLFGLILGVVLGVVLGCIRDARRRAMASVLANP